MGDHIASAMSCPSIWLERSWLENAIFPSRIRAVSTGQYHPPRSISAKLSRKW